MSSAVVGVANTSADGVPEAAADHERDVGDDQRDECGEDHRRPEQRREQRGDHPGAAGRDERGLEAERQQGPGPGGSQRLLRLLGHDQAEGLEPRGDQVLDALRRQRPAVRRADGVGDLLRRRGAARRGRRPGGGARRAGPPGRRPVGPGRPDRADPTPGPHPGTAGPWPVAIAARWLPMGRWCASVVRSGCCSSSLWCALGGRSWRRRARQSKHAHRLVEITASGPRRGTASPGHSPAS